MTPLADRIKQFEGYTANPVWDYKQWSVGHGTRASGPDDVVDETEAARRLEAELAPATAIVDKAAPGLAPGVRDALISLTYNAGDQWTRSGLGEAIRAGDLNRARELFVQYNKAGGAELPGLTKRRQTELSWWDAPADSNSAPGVAPAAQASTLAAAPQTPATGEIQGLLSPVLAGLSGEQPSRTSKPAKDDLSPMNFVPELSAERIAYPQIRRMAPQQRLAVARAAVRGRA